VASAEEFAEFAEIMSPRLRRMAFLLCGDWHTGGSGADGAGEGVRLLAQDQAAGRGARYATRTLVNTYLAHRRLKRNGEVLRSWLPEPLAEAPAPETRMVLLDALATLPPRSRAVVVLRYWADLSVDQAAAVLGCSPGNVKSQSARALDRLRAVLGDAMTEFGPPGRPREERYERNAPHG
jgi:DNA-directed RNA polymerase specialized sigma24 family protein